MAYTVTLEDGTVETRRGPKPYNGHHCWNCWNVALWIGNDEGLYRAAVSCQTRTTQGDVKNTAKATRLFFREVMPEGSRTPDGAKYTWRAVWNAINDLE